MPLRITLDIFSGGENPSVVLDGPAALEVLSRLKPVRKTRKKEIRPEPESILGYRGLLFEQIGHLAAGLPRAFRLADGILYTPRGQYRIEDEEFEAYFTGSTGPLRRLQLDPKLLALFERERQRLHEILLRWRRRPVRWPTAVRCRCAPLNEPAWWNDGGLRQYSNNCYNYACNYRTDTYAQPGLAAGVACTPVSSAVVSSAAVADDLMIRPAAGNRCPEEGHLVALVVAPGIDFHWYRKGRNGYWTHKPGPTPATNVDNSGRLILDPRTADRGMYTDFCSFLVVMHGHTKIK